MGRWLALPLVALVVLSTSGFLDALERASQESLRLATASKEAPKSTSAAAREVSDLPLIERLTNRQAEAFKSLANALETSAQKARSFSTEVQGQVAAVSEVAEDINAIDRPISCVKEKLRALVAVSNRSPAALDEIRSILTGVVTTQNKSIHHLKSINRKLTAFGVVARATGVEPPPPPKGAPIPQAGPSPETNPC